VNQQMISKLVDQVFLEILNYLPRVLASLLLLLVGWFIGWLAKRIVIQLFMIFRVHNYLPRMRWQKALSKADVRDALFNYVGNLVFIAVFIMFIYGALATLKLTVLSNLLEHTIFFLPRVAGCFVIFAIGLFLSNQISVVVHMAVLREGIPRASLIARFVKGAMVIFFSAMALTVLDFARQVVIVGFTVSFATLGALVVVAAVAGGKELFQKIFHWPEEK
jgi:Mechanosensitive ion channel, conserved TM helix